MVQQLLVDYANEVFDVSFPRWDDLPKFDLHMDQVLELLNEYLAVLKLTNDPLVTKSMIHNYLKLELIPKPQKKRYNRKHLAYLIAIIMLKNIITIPEIKTGVMHQSKVSGLKGAYELLITVQENAFKHAASLYLDQNFERGEVHPEDRFSLVRQVTDNLASQTFVKLFLENTESKA